MEEAKLLVELEELKSQLRQIDKERSETLKLDELRNEHRSLKSPDSEMILYLIRAIFKAQNEIARLKNVVKNYKQAQEQRESMRAKAVA